MIKVHMFQSGYGDCLLVQVISTDNRNVNIMIDCGFGYKELLPRLKSILGEDGKIDRFIITHYDSDHIRGALSLFMENSLAINPTNFKIEQVWLNSYRHLQFFERDNEEVSTVLKRRVDAYMAEKESKNEMMDNEGGISARQASTLASVIYRNGYKWNEDSNGKAICTENVSEIKISDSVKLNILTPSKESLKELEKSFVLDLDKMGLKPNKNEIFDDAFEVYQQSADRDSSVREGTVSACENVIDVNTVKTLSKGDNYNADDSVGNGSSISFILEAENKKLLFLGDAYAEDVINSLKQRYKDNIESPMFFDLIKVSHHGSFRNNSPELHGMIDSDRYLFSTNGCHPKHCHPDVETIACIINRPLNKSESKRKLHFNFDLEHLSEFNNDEIKSKFNYDVIVGTEIDI